MDEWRKCSRCGQTHFVGTDGLCPDCRRDDHAALELEDGETEFTGEDEVRCPWCGKRVHYKECVDDDILCDGGIDTCPHCGKRYDVHVEVHFTYDTKRVIS